MEILFISKNKPKKECGTTFIARAVCANAMGLIFILPLIEVQLGLIEMGANTPIFVKQLSAYTDRQLLKLGNTYYAEMQKPDADIEEAILAAIDLLDDEIAAEQADDDLYAVDDQELYAETLSMS